jgi:hypothetical protein
LLEARPFQPKQPLLFFVSSVFSVVNSFFEGLRPVFQLCEHDEQEVLAALHLLSVLGVQ